MKNKRLKLLIVVLVFVSCLFLNKYKSTFGIYRDVLNTKVYLSILDPGNTYTITLHLEDGSGDTTTITQSLNSEVGPLPTPTRTNYNFIGWYTSDGQTKLQPSDTFSADDDYYAHWQKIVCRKAPQNTLHSEICQSDGICTGLNTPNVAMNYGTLPTQNSPIIGDAYDCDLDDNGQFNTSTERFYFVRKNGDNAALVYDSSLDANGRAESLTSAVEYSYDAGKAYLPTSSTWTNSALQDFDGKVARYISSDDLTTACNSNTLANVSFGTCQYFLENTKFQSETLGKTGIWIEKVGNDEYRIQTSTLAIESVTNSTNMVRPVIEIPYTAMEGYKEPNAYVVTFNSNGGTHFNSITVNEGDTIEDLLNPLKDDYKFLGWYSDPNFQTRVYDTTPITGTTTLYAKWEATYDNLETVFHIPGKCIFDGGTSITSTNNNCISIINPTNQEIDHTTTTKKFIDTGVSLYSHDNIGKDYEIGFTIETYDPAANVHRATIMSTKKEETGYPGAVFRRDESTTSFILQVRQTSTANAQQTWSSANVKSVVIKRTNGTVSYSINGGAAVDITTPQYNPEFDLTTWFAAGPKNAAGTTYQRYLNGQLSGMYIKLEKDVIPEHTVTFNAGDGTASQSSIHVNHGDTIGTANMPTASNPGYHFDGWYTAGGTLVDGTEQIADDVTYYAHYRNIYYINFDGGQGTVSRTPIDVIDGESIGIANMPTASLSGYQFIGWFSAANGGTQYYGNETISADDTYYAHYRQVHTVTFVPGNGTLSIAPDTTIQVGHGETLGANMPTASLTGYKFVGWFDSTGQTQYGADLPINADVTYYAQYKILHTITFAPGDGTLSIAPETTIKIADGESIGTANMPTATQTNYDFDGWFDSTGQTQYYGNETILADDTYYAHWTPSNVYIISFDTDGGSSVPDMRVTRGTSLGTLPAEPIKTDYTFIKWVDENNQDVTTATTPSQDETYYAVWYADEDIVAKIGDKSYLSLADAYADINTSNETTITIMKDITISEGITIASNRNVVIDLQNHTIESPAGTIFTNNGTLTINTAGTLMGTTASEKGTIINNTGAILNIANATIASTKYNVIINSGTFTMSSGTIYTKYDQGCINNNASGTITMTGGQIISKGNRQAIYNLGTVSISGDSLLTSENNGSARAILQNQAGGTVRITSGSIIGKSSGAIKNAGTLIIGTPNNGYDTTTPLIQGAGSAGTGNNDQRGYGIYSTTNYELYDGIIKGTVDAVNNQNKITQTENGTAPVTGEESGYKYLYYELTTGNRITFTTNGGEVNPASKKLAENTAVTASFLPTPTRDDYYFDGWYYDNNTFNVSAIGRIPTTDEEYFAKWLPSVTLANITNETINLLVNGTEQINVTNSSSIEQYTYSANNTGIATVDSNGVVTAHKAGVTKIALTGTSTGNIKYVTVNVNLANDIESFDIMPTAMRKYFDNVSTWTTSQTDTSHSDYDTYMASNLSENDCVNFDGDNRSVKSSSTGTVYCDLPNHYNTGVSGNVNVYEYDVANDTKTLITYVTANNGELYNFIPGKVYYWESATNTSINGKLYAYGERRIIQIDNLKSGSNDTYYQTRNVRDLGGIAVTYSDTNNAAVNGTIKYGKLYRGEKIWGGDGSSLQYFTKLGINHEMDLRGNSEPITSEEDSFAIANKITSDSNDATVTTYKIVQYGIDYNSQYISNYTLARNSLIEVMNAFIADPNYSLYFHCKTGADETGTLAYLLEGLLGVSEEDRYRDYEMTVFFGLDERTRFYTNKTSNYVKFVHMKQAIRDAGDGIHEDVVAWFLRGSTNTTADMALIQQFRTAMVERNN